MFTAVDNLSFQWAIYAPTTEDNTRGLVADICAALGLNEPTAAGSDASGGIIASKIQRYLAQHPYVRELSLNVFNPGAATIVAEALRMLQQAPEYAHLRYDLRLFAPDPDSPVLGEALDSLLRPDTVTRESDDAFTASTGNHLFPKIRLAKHAVAEFRADPGAFAAHLSILLDVFPAEDFSVKVKPTGVTPMGGLIQDFAIDYTDDESGTYWTKWPIVGQPVNPADNAVDELLANLAMTVTHATAAVASAGAGFTSVPVVTLGLDVGARQLIFDVHQSSDWVLTVDRNMGIEFFDHGGLKARPDYLIDYVPGGTAQATHNLIVSSRSHIELEAMLKPVLDSHGLSADPDQAVAILASLRSLSGQLALKLISSPTQQAEALGLALARLYLDYQGALGDQVIVPLDAHTDLYRPDSPPGEGAEPTSLQRTDLALFDLNLSTRTITCNLVEVKCYTQVGDLSAFNQLKERIAGQIEQSERVMQRHFDPNKQIPDRPDRPLKSRELAQILSFYLSRSVRYGILDQVAAQEAKAFLASIEDGYSLQFRRSALIFDFDKTGTDTDHEVGIEYHRVGKDLVTSLLEACAKSARTTDGPTATEPLSEQFIPSVPKLESAAFITPRRERTTAWTTGDGWDRAPTSEPDMLTQDKPAPDWEGTPTPVAGVGHPDPGAEPPTHEQDEAREPHHPVPTTPEGPTPHAYGASPERLDHDVMLGVKGESPQYGILGEVSGRRVALDLNGTHTISLFGVQGGGKSYTLGTVIEMASMPIPRINVLPKPLASVIFHYSPTLDYPPEFTSLTHPNTADDEIRLLRESYHATPEGLKDVLLLTTREKVSQRQADYPDINVQAISFASSELNAAHWKFLMGAIGSQSMYMRQINLIMRGLRGNLTLAGLRTGIDNSGLADHLKDLARTRLRFAEEYIDDRQRLQDLIRPGRLVIVDLRDEYIEKDEALGLFVVLLQIFSEATYEGKTFNKLVVFDEAHKYVENAELVAGLVEVVREMRHKGTSIMVASQDPPSVPISLIELSSQIILHRFNSPAWLKHIQKANTALSGLTAEKMGHLGTGEAYVWSSKASDEAFTTGAMKVTLRPRVTQHGGGTRTAVNS
ncbi:MAG: ATP-binding protein [Nigerium sp.]|nr:ATP-binding protein [Nigerium sp.]